MFSVDVRAWCNVDYIALFFPQCPRSSSTQLVPLCCSAVLALPGLQCHARIPVLMSCKVLLLDGLCRACASEVSVLAWQYGDASTSVTVCGCECAVHDQVTDDRVAGLDATIGGKLVD